MPVSAPKIITCSQWGARKPKRAIVVVGRPDKCLVHHTDGHGIIHATTPDGAWTQAIAYAQTLQGVHMIDRGWNDSGHSFLIMRSGLILQGRWGTVTAIEHGRMVESAHCPGQNGNPGVEFEHIPGEVLTAAQEAAGIRLFAWIMAHCAISPTALYGHNDFYNTECPDNLHPLIKGWRARIAWEINRYGRVSAPTGGFRRANRAVQKEIKMK